MYHHCVIYRIATLVPDLGVTSRVTMKNTLRIVDHLILVCLYFFQKIQYMLKDLKKNSSFRQLELVTVAEKRPKKPEYMLYQH